MVKRGLGVGGFARFRFSLGLPLSALNTGEIKKPSFGGWALRFAAGFEAAAGRFTWSFSWSPFSFPLVC